MWDSLNRLSMTSKSLETTQRAIRLGMTAVALPIQRLSHRPGPVRIHPFPNFALADRLFLTPHQPLPSA